MIKPRSFLTICCIFFTVIILNTAASAVSIPAGEPAPDFTLHSLVGSKISLHDYKGSIVVLIYFRSDHKRSIFALEEINTIRDKYDDKDVQFLGISAESENSDEILKRMKELNIDFPVLLDIARDVYGSYGIRVYPTTLIIDREGHVADAMPGHALSYKIRLDATLQHVLGKINKEQLLELISPKKKARDVKALYAERKYNLALKFTEAGLSDQAIVFLKQAIEAKPDIVKSHILLGYLYLDDREPEKAIEQFEKALNIQPSSKDAETGLGSALIEKGDYDSAIEILTRALFLNPYPEKTLYALGRAHELKGAPGTASELYKKTLEQVFDHHLLPASIAHCE